MVDWSLFVQNFVRRAVNDTTKSTECPEFLHAVREDVGVIECTLQFINDILQDMLDMQ